MVWILIFLMLATVVKLIQGKNKDELILVLKVVLIISPINFEREIIVSSTTLCPGGAIREV